LGSLAIAAAIAVVIWLAVRMPSDSGYPQANVDAGSRMGSAKTRQAPPTGATLSSAWPDGVDTAPVSKKGTSPQKTAATWVNISYADLVDMDQLTSSGDTVRDILQSPDLRSWHRGEVQPHLDRFAELLPTALEVMQGPDHRPQRNVVEQFHVGSTQPCWVAIFRSGRVVVTSDGCGKARAFLPGEDARRAYDTYYSVIRHPLAGLAGPGIAQLEVEVFAYRNDYSSCELKLNPASHTVKAAAFPPPPGKRPVDIRGLQAFFEKGGELVGGELDRDRGLSLFARASQEQRVAGQPVSLADFAVAYRAVFHAGDNKAFVSLDRHRDPTRVTVNFGGFLEHTRVGSVLLEADKRFKTITTGLDPVSSRDVRNYTRRFVTDFLTVSEIDLLDRAQASSQWKSTRFWYYPESVEVEAELDYSYAVIQKAQFTADAERGRKDFVSATAFEQSRKTSLSPGVRRNINDLNARYTHYAAAFPELRELGVCARLIGICCWLDRAKPSYLDLDALLSVELPAVTTERERTQLLASCQACVVEGQASAFRPEPVVAYLGDVLDKPFTAFFQSPDAVAEYLCHRNNFDEKESARFVLEASELYASSASGPVRAIVRTDKDLKALVSYAAGRLDVPLPPEVSEMEQQIEAASAKLENLRSQLEKLRAMMAQSTYSHNRYLDRHNTLVDEYERARLWLKGQAEKDLAKSLTQASVSQISGGIELAPDKFSVRRVRNSPLLARLRELSGRVGTEWTVVDGGERWVRSPGEAGRDTSVVAKLADGWREVSERTPGSALIRTTTAHDGSRYWFSQDTGSRKWQDQVTRPDGRVSQRLFDPSSKRLNIVHHEGGSLKEHVTAEIQSENRIVFRKSGRRDLLPPASPPRWWQE